MKINVSDTAALEAVFSKFRAGQFKYEAADVAPLAERAEARIELLPKKARVGARCVLLSGGAKLPNSYRNTRKVTRIVLERGGEAWFVVKVEECELWPNQSGGCRISLSDDQLTKLRAAHEADLLNF